MTSLSGDNSATYVYDASGNRVRKITGGVTTDYIYGASGNVVAEYSGGAWTRGYVYSSAGQLVAQYDGAIGATGATTLFVHKDHLGSTRVLTTVSASVSDSMDYLPFGEQIAGSTGSSHKFTGKERDAESGLDDFDARYYSSALGRFISADWSATPEPVPYADFHDPQSLNLYAYVRNIPMTNVDANGHETSVWDVVNFVAAAVNALGSDNVAGAGRDDKANNATTAGKAGAATGDAVATLQGAAEVILGAGGEVAGVVLDATGVGAIVGVPANVASAVVIAHGATTGVEGGVHLFKDAENAIKGEGPKAKDAPGVTAGGQATDKYGNKLGPSGEKQVNTTTSNTREGARNKALNQGSGAVEHSNPQHGENPHFHSTDNKGKKKPSSAHHEYPQ